MSVSTYKQEAKSNLAGKWGKAILISVVYAITNFFIEFLLELIFKKPLLFSILNFLITTPLSLGYIFSCVKIYNNEDVSIFGFITYGFQNLINSFLVPIMLFLKLILPVIILFVSLGMGIYFQFSFNKGLSIICLVISIGAGIYVFFKCLTYTFTYFILAENPDYTALQAMDMSEAQMNGRKGEYVFLLLSFIGWIILIYFVGILLAFILKSLAIISSILIMIVIYIFSLYIQFTTIAFYKNSNEVNNNFESAKLKRE